MAQQNQRNERSLEIRLVESFCVTPVMPQRTSARIANPSHAIQQSFQLRIEQINGHKSQSEANPLQAAEAFF